MSFSYCLRTYFGKKIIQVGLSVDYYTKKVVKSGVAYCTIYLHYKTF